MKGTRSMRLMAMVAVGIAIAVPTGCAAGDDPGASPRRPTAQESAAPTVSETRTQQQAERVEVTVRAGRVSGPREAVQVPVGGLVELVVTSDVADEVHVHGTDKSAHVEPGRPATVRFTAVAPGKFEIELEHSKLPLLELEVR